MMGSNAVPGSDGVFALLQALADPDQVKKNLADIVKATDEANAKIDEANQATAKQATEALKQLKDLTNAKIEADAATQKASDQMLAAQNAMAKLDGEYAAKGRELEAREKALVQETRAASDTLYARSKACEERELAAAQATHNANDLFEEAQADAAAAAKAKKLYEDKFNEIQAKLKALASGSL